MTRNETEFRFVYLKREKASMWTILLIVVLAVLILGGGGGYYSRRRSGSGR